MKNMKNLKDRQNTPLGRIYFFSLACIVFVYLTIFFIIYPPRPFNTTLMEDITQEALPTKHDKDRRCDLFRGRWIRDLNRSIYTNETCPTIPVSKNCGRHGRSDTEYLQWRWKPDECELPRFQPENFLRLVRGKKMAFIGDSVARNQMESLLCLLSQAETPIDTYKDSEDRDRTWHFPTHNFTLMVIWTKFLVPATERLTNGTSSGDYDLQIDSPDPAWASKLPSPIDYIVLSDGHWFFRKLYLHNNNNNTIIGCVFCSEPDTNHLGPAHAIGLTLRTALHFLKKYNEHTTTIVRTFSPSHFENGVWNTGGTCNRTWPLREGDVDLKGYELEVRGAQVEELERVRVGGGRIGVVDVTKMMLVRADGHPGVHWDNQYMKGYSDCVHWCLPGPIDAWNELLLAVIAGLS
ncbi:hypothetical protein QJS04_geneDACA006896 [Acorus gramineus]|uniref:Trichome birefringence-like N-terminal domain-containing protein n=1 Tax=Acorus gramineus TaxID=55184 RepID=A0AAV9AXU9_ACOGR|nr:hypothetical protein QJS04_geneDACA006896 [Acorus gramineus]